MRAVAPLPAACRLGVRAACRSRSASLLAGPRNKLFDPSGSKLPEPKRKQACAIQSAGAPSRRGGREQLSLGAGGSN